MTLFQLENVTLSSGVVSPFKIECDALTDDDWQCLAYLITQTIPAFGSVEDVPIGGFKLAAHLHEHRSNGPLLIVDDVLTTGVSMEKQRNGRDVMGAVAFACGECPEWVTPLFQMPPKMENNAK